MNKDLGLIGSVGLGVFLMYVLDPLGGKRRRAVARDKAIRFAHKTADAIDTTSRDLKNRALGVAARARSLVSEGEVSDDVLAERVRSKLGFLVSHPSSVSVTVHEGKVILSGPILRDEVDRLLSRVSSIRSVKEVESRLEVHENADSVPGLQGEPQRRKTGGVPDFMQANWSPATRFLAGAASGALLLYGARQRNMLGAALASLGSVIGARALANIEFKRLFGLGAGHRAIDIHKTMNVNAPVHEVFSFWTNYENFPRFMSNVREVTQINESQSHWVVAGPAGMPVEWDAVITDYVLNQRLGWKTVPGSPIQHAGLVEFRSNPDGTACLDIRMSYNPVAGALGHAVAALFGADPKSEMDEDLLRMKTLIEAGGPPHDAAHAAGERGAYTH